MIGDLPDDGNDSASPARSEPQIRVGENPDRHLSATGHKPTSMAPRRLSNSIRERRPARVWIEG